MDQTLSAAYQYAYSSNLLYNDNKARWQFLLESYLGGEAYRKAAHLTRYQLENEREYSARLANTPLANHCKSIIATYISFLFRQDAERELGVWETNPAVQSFIGDADLEGSELDDFMKSLTTWALVFGHSWCILSKPNINAVTMADEIAAGVRPYASVLTPLTVLDWRWERQLNGSYKLSYFKYIEDVNDQVTIIREWTRDSIKTYEANEQKKQALVVLEEVNQLGEIPAVVCYAQRGLVRGLGISVIDDIADMQKSIYNELSEVADSIRLEGHPSIVVTPGTQYGNGAGAVIVIPNDLDAGLKPYMLNVDAVPVAQVWDSIKNRVESIDKMANTGSIRGTESVTMSGVAREVEFQLLNAKLSEIADNVELAEKQMWSFFGAYQNLDDSDFDVDYPDSFSIRDTGNEYKMLSEAKGSSGSAESSAVIDLRLRQLLEDPRVQGMTDLEALAMMSATPEVEEATSAMVVVEEPEDYVEEPEDGCPIETQDIAANLANRQKAIDTAAYGPLNPQLPNTVFWAKKADMWTVDAATAKTSVCGNCAAFNQTQRILACIDTGLAAGGSGEADAWDTVAAGDLGYCEAFDFKCASSRTCDAWITGGPITD